MSELVKLGDSTPAPFMHHLNAGGHELAIGGPSDMAGWVKNHSWEARRIQKHAAEQFLTPIPFPDVAAWREAAGYRYGDDYPGHAGWSLTLADKKRQSMNSTEGEDTSLRLNLFIKQKGDKKLYSSLPLAVHYGRNSNPRPDGSIDWPTLSLRVGTKQIYEFGLELDARPAQELLLVATKLLLSKANTVQADQTEEVKRRRLFGRNRKALNA
jgi:hypothetical protein